MHKVFISPETMRNNSFRLGAQIYASGFYPDVIYIVLRGGANTGNPISEFFKWVRAEHPELRRILFAAVTARSYTGIGEREEVRVEGWTYHPDHLRCGDRVLFLDDVYDRGLTISHLVGIIMNKGIPRNDIKVAVHDYKRRIYLNPPPLVVPDFWHQCYELRKPEDDPWLHYLSHELEGLTEEEMRKQLFPHDSELVDFLIQARDLAPSRT